MAVASVTPQSWALLSMSPSRACLMVMRSPGRRPMPLL